MKSGGLGANANANAKARAGRGRWGSGVRRCAGGWRSVFNGLGFVVEADGTFAFELGEALGEGGEEGGLEGGIAGGVDVDGDADEFGGGTEDGEAVYGAGAGRGGRIDAFDGECAALGADVEEGVLVKAEVLGGVVGVGDGGFAAADGDIGGGGDVGPVGGDFEGGGCLGGRSDSGGEEGGGAGGGAGGKGEKRDEEEEEAGGDREKP